MGRAVVEGERMPDVLAALSPAPRCSSPPVEDILTNSQREFWGLDMDHAGPDSEAMRETRFGLDVAEADGTLYAVGSTYSAESHAVYDGLPARACGSSPSPRCSSTESSRSPTPCRWLLDVGQRGMSRPAEIEFAVRLSRKPDEPHEFGFLQMRPLVISQRIRRARPRRGGLGITGMPKPDGARQRHGRAPRRGGGRLRPLPTARASRDVAAEITRYNAELMAAGQPYLLIGVGRWGSADPWLGIPVAVGADRRRAGDRRVRLPRLPRHALPGQSFLPEPDFVPGRLLHRECRRGRGVRALGLAGRAAGGERARRRASPRVSIGRSWCA